MRPACFQWLPAQRRFAQIILHKGIIQVGLQTREYCIIVALLGILLMVYMHCVLQFKYICPIWQKQSGGLYLPICADWLHLRETLKPGREKVSLPLPASLFILPLSAPSPWNHLASHVTPSPQGPPQGLSLASIMRPEGRGNGHLISDRTEQHLFPFPKEVTASMPVACDFLALWELGWIISCSL